MVGLTGSDKRPVSQLFSTLQGPRPREGGENKVSLQ